MNLATFLQAAVTATLLLLVSCGGDKRSFSEACGDNDKCEDGLYCAQGGVMKGLCTIDCSSTNTGICKSRFGSLAYCHINEVCAMECASTGMTCPQGARCNSSGIPDTCVR